MQTNKYSIYILKNIINNKVYVGQTTNPNTRKRQHFSLLTRSKHPNKHLQSSYNKYGKNCFIFEIIETVEDKTEITIRESYWTEYYKKTTEIYNQRVCVESNKGYKLGPRSEEVKNKISQRHKELGTKPPNRKGCKSYKQETDIKKIQKVYKLNLDLAKEIRKLYSQGNFTYKQLGVMFGVVSRTIGDVIQNKIYKE